MDQRSFKGPAAYVADLDRSRALCEGRLAADGIGLDAIAERSSVAPAQVDAYLAGEN